MEYYLGIREQGNLTTCDNMKGTWRHCTESNKSEKDKYYIFSLICRIQNKTEQKTTKLKEKSDLWLP